MRLLSVAMSVCLLGVMAGSVRGEPAVKATKKPVVVERKIFDPKHPPTPPPPIGKNEVAVCVAATGCAATFESETVSQRKTAKGVEASVRFSSIAVTVDLKITIWLPKDASATVKEHEETHREIAERVYENADKAAREAANRVVGRTYVGSGATLAAAEKDALQKIQSELMAGYMARAGDVWTRVNELFDEITAHGKRSAPGVRNRIDAKEGMEEAFKRYEKEAAKK